MENESNNVKKEIESLDSSLPAPKVYETPVGYFDKLPAIILNRWEENKSIPLQVKKNRYRIIGIAAIITGLLISGVWILMQNHTNDSTEITSREAYEYVQENFIEFEDLIETIGIYQSELDEVPADHIEEYLIEELNSRDPEELF